MAVPGTKAKEIAFLQNGDDVTVKANGVSVEIHADGSILAYTNGNVKVCPFANDDVKAPTTSPQHLIDHEMRDGTIYAGISPDTHKPMYATPADASLTMTFNEATEYAAMLDAHGHQDWRVPTKAELNVLFNNRAAIGGFDMSGSAPASWYWSSSPDAKWIAWAQRFSDGFQSYLNQGNHASVRYVR